MEVAIRRMRIVTETRRTTSKPTPEAEDDKLNESGRIKNQKYILEKWSTKMKFYPDGNCTRTKKNWFKGKQREYSVKLQQKEEADPKKWKKNRMKKLRKQLSKLTS